jgi:hypothetical protein
MRHFQIISFWSNCMLRLFSLFGMAFLAAAAVALTTPSPLKPVRRDRRLSDNINPDRRVLPSPRPLTAQPLYYARFSVN